MANFVAELIARLSPSSCLIDASRGTMHHHLGQSVAGMSAWLAAQGLTPGDRLVLAMDLTCESTLAYLACLHAGLVAVPVEPAGAGAAMAATAAKGMWRPRPEVARDARAAIDLCGLHDAAPAAAHPVAAADLAVLMATSGTSGDGPRFVRTTHGNLIANTDAIVRSQHLGPDDRALLTLPQFYCFGTSVLHSHLWAGGSVVLERRFMFPQKAVDSIRTHGCTTFAGVPMSYLALLAHSDYAGTPLPSLRRQLQAGGRLDAAVIDRLRAAHPAAGMYVMYGQTEATARISTLQPEDWERKRGSVGRPLDGLEVALRPLGDGYAEDEGELLVRGASITDGYWQDLAPHSADGWLATGDVAHIDADGYIFIRSRLSEFVKVRGVRVSLAAVDERLKTVPGLVEVAACGVPDPQVGEALLIAAVPMAAACDRAALAQAMRAALPPAWTVAEIRFVAALPRTASGKLARGNLARIPSAPSANMCVDVMPNPGERT